MTVTLQQQLPRTALAKVPRQRRSVETVHTILDAAKRVLEREGLMAFNTNRVAEVAGISVGSLYQYFPNKDALLLGVMERGLAMTDDIVRETMTRVQPHDFEEGLREVLRALIQHLTPRRALLREVLAGTPLLAETGFLSVVEGGVRDLLARLEAAQGRPPFSPSASFVAVNSLAFVLFKWITDPPPHVDEEAFVAAAVQLVVAFRPDGRSDGRLDAS
ncbi:MAG: TetR/AcrR family transcriptional regulator [Polyangiaceae bacterium]